MDLPVGGGGDDVLHLHGLEYDESGAGLDALVLSRNKLHDATGHGRDDDGSRARRLLGSMRDRGDDQLSVGGGVASLTLEPHCLDNPNKIYNKLQKDKNQSEFKYYRQRQ